MTFHAVVVAAGTGARAGPGPAKQWRRLGGRALVRWCVEAMAGAGAADIVVVAPTGAEAKLAEALTGVDRWRMVAGGATRALSVRAGLAAIRAPGEAIVLIHDAARPFLQRSHVDALLPVVGRNAGALLALPIADTLKLAAGGPGEANVRTVGREGLWRAQTPQAFRLADILAAYASWDGADTPTDDAQVFERAGGHVTLVQGDPRLFKLTHPEDFAMADRLAGAAWATRVGFGFDAHRFGPGDSLTLCGVAVAHEHGLIGHSDADVGLHALTDALLGAIAAGDIGDHFPPDDPRWRGCASSVFVEHAVALVSAVGGRIINADITLICEAPRIKPHRAAMREQVARLLGLAADRVSLKATTTEAMGFTGRREGLAAQAVVSVETPL